MSTANTLASEMTILQKYVLELAKSGIINSSKSVHLAEDLVTFSLNLCNLIDKTEVISETICLENVWIAWDGGECPVKEYEYVDVRFRDLHIAYNQCVANLRWAHIDHNSDIVQYRVSTKKNDEYIIKTSKDITITLPPANPVTSEDFYNPSKWPAGCDVMVKDSSDSFWKYAKFIKYCPHESHPFKVEMWCSPDNYTTSYMYAKRIHIYD